MSKANGGRKRPKRTVYKNKRRTQRERKTDMDSRACHRCGCANVIPGTDCPSCGTYRPRESDLPV